MEPIDQALLDRLTTAAASSPRRRRNHDFHRSLDEPSHRFLNAVEPGTYIRPHRHLDPPKDETLLAVRGQMLVVVFDDAGGLAACRRIEPGGSCVGANLPFDRYHTLLSLTAGAVFLESKPGPYRPLQEADFAPWAPPEGSPEAGTFVSDLIARATRLLDSLPERKSA